VFKTCWSVLRNPDDAADASQEVFLIAADSLQPGTSTAAARAWLQTVARNHCLDELRRRKRLGRALVTLGADDDAREDVANAVADRDFVDAVFKKLSPRERQALWHSAVEHRPVDDIAGRLRLSYMAAAQVIHRARRHALQLASRVAIVFGIFRLGRRASRASVTFVRVAAVPMIALSAISIQTSGQPATPAIAPGSAVSVQAVHRAHAGSNPSGSGSSNASASLGGVLPGLPGVVPANPSSAITSAVNAVRGLSITPSLTLPLRGREPKLTIPNLP
jgi:RNA polymerase sigma factor (sigma-70 family)